MKTFFSFLPLLFIIFSIPAFCGDINSGLAAYWSFNGCSLADSSSNGYNGLQTIGTTCIPGVSGDGRFFDGKTGFVDVGNKNIISSGDTVTFIAWVYLDPKPADPFQAIITKWENSGGPQEWWFGIYEDAIHFTTQGFPCFTYCPQRMSKPLGFKGACWTMIGAILTGNRVQYVLNGVVVDTDSNNKYTFSSKPTSVRIGRQNPDNRAVGYYTGGLDELRIYKRALSPDDLLTLYNNYKSKIKIHFTFGQTQSIKPGAEDYFPLTVQSDDWQNTPVNSFVADIKYRSNWHYIPNSISNSQILIPGDLTASGWTISYIDTVIDNYFRKVSIKGNGTTPLSKNGTVAQIKLGTFLADTIAHTPSITIQTFSTQPGGCFGADGSAKTTTVAACFANGRTVRGSLIPYSFVITSVAEKHVTINYSLGFPSSYKFTVYDLNGQVITTINRNSHEGFFSNDLPLESFSTGLYLLHFQSELYSETQLFFLQ